MVPKIGDRVVWTTNSAFSGTVRTGTVERVEDTNLEGHVFDALLDNGITRVWGFVSHIVMINGRPVIE